MFYPKSPLFEEAQEGNPGGGDAPPQDGDAPHDGNQPHDPPPAPPALTLDALKDLFKSEREVTKREISNQVNGLAANLNKKFEAKKEPPKPDIMTAEQMLADYKRESEERIAVIERDRERERNESQQKEMDAEVKSALSDFAWTTDAKGIAEGKDVALTFYRPQVQRDDNGTFVIGAMPLGAYIKEDAARRFKPYHTARPIGGSGNPGGKNNAPPTIMNDTLQTKARSGERLTDSERAALHAELAANPLLLKR